MADISRYKGGACKKMSRGGPVKSTGPKNPPSVELKNARRARPMAVGGQVPNAIPTPPEIYPGKPGVPFETPRPPTQPPFKPPVPLETPRPPPTSAIPMRGGSQPGLNAYKRGGKIKKKK